MTTHWRLFHGCYDPIRRENNQSIAQSINQLMNALLNHNVIEAQWLLNGSEVGQWLLAGGITGEWLLSSDYCRVITDEWLLASDYWRVITGEWLLAAGGGPLADSEVSDCPVDGVRAVQVHPTVLLRAGGGGGLTDVTGTFWVMPMWWSFQKKKNIHVRELLNIHIYPTIWFWFSKKVLT